MRIAVLHHVTSKFAGGISLMVSAVEALYKAGYDITFYSYKSFNPYKLCKAYGKNFGKDLFFTQKFLPVQFKRFRIYQLLALSAYYDFMGDEDVVLNTYAALPILVHKPYLFYMHFPYGFFERAPKTLSWRFYGIPYYLIDRLARFINLSRIKVLTNSTYTQHMIKQRLKVNAEVIYPSVDIRRFSKVVKNNDRKPWICTIGRITPSKKQLTQLLIGRELVKRGVDFQMHIIGLLNTFSKASVNYYNRLLKLKEKWNLQDVVQFHLNAPFSELLSILENTKVFLHTMYEKTEHGMRGEHFGVSCVEAMAAGCVPVAWTIPSGLYWDILKFGKFGFGFKDIKEAADIVEQLLSDSTQWKAWHKKAVDRSKRFSEEELQKRVEEIVKSVVR